ncbi:Spy/CpxP family protein refolding chaperone [candidate division KSB1 bacterium]
MKRFKIVFLVSFVFTLFFAELSYSQGWARGRGMGRMRNQNLSANFYYPGNTKLNFGYPGCLNLSQDQITKLDELFLEYNNSTVNILDDLSRRTLELENFLMQSTINKSAFSNLADEIIKLKANIQEKDVQHIDKVKNILNDTQKQLIENLNLGYQWSLSIYAASPGYNSGYGYGRGAGMGRGYSNMRGLGIYGRNIMGSPRIGRGPCGLGLGRTGAWRRWWR